MNPVRYVNVVVGTVKKLTGVHPSVLDWGAFRASYPREFQACVKQLSRVPNGSRPKWCGYAFNANR